MTRLAGGSGAARPASGLLAIAAVLATLLVMGPAWAQDGDEFSIVFPQPDPRTHFIDDFGAPRRGHRHQGIDLIGEKLMPVVAVADGTVERLAWHRSAGYYIVLRHADGWTSTYMHLNNDRPGADRGRAGSESAYLPGIEEGAAVRAGQQIAWVGDSGNAEWSVPHTHFELAHHGRVVNPYPYLVAAWERLLEEWAAARRGSLTAVR
ncbi:MAG: M23 family metallopeptidase [Acidimicrobiia bacterium]